MVYKFKRKNKYIAKVEKLFNLDNGKFELDLSYFQYYLFDRKKNVTIYAPLQTGKTEDSKKALLLLNSQNIIKKKINIDEYDLIIDCLFGVGLNRSIPDKLNNLIGLLNLI